MAVPKNKTSHARKSSRRSTVWKINAPELTGEILKVIKELAKEKMTMVIVTHEMAFARDVANHVIFMDDGYIVEEGTPEEVFGQTQNERTKQFLQRFNDR